MNAVPETRWQSERGGRLEGARQCAPTIAAAGEVIGVIRGGVQGGDDDADQSGARIAWDAGLAAELL
jgi:hypothetical protein